MTIKKINGWLILLLSFSILVACSSGPSPEEEIYKTLEKVVSLEEVFKEQQEPLVKLEKSEKEIYDQIIALSMKEFDKIVALSNDALTIVDEREQRINNEQTSLVSAQEEFLLIKDEVEMIEEDELKSEAENLIELMNNRYSTYGQLYEKYKEALSFDRELYQLFKKEDLSIDELEEQIGKINSTYEQVIGINEEFNQITEQYNQAKVSFYKNAGLEVVYNTNGEGITSESESTTEDKK